MVFFLKNTILALSLNLTESSLRVYINLLRLNLIR